MNIRILRSECCGSGSCAEIAPNVFSRDSKNKAIVLDAEAATAELIQEAAESCPCAAIVLVDDEGNTLVP